MIKDFSWLCRYCSKDGNNLAVVRHAPKSLSGMHRNHCPACAEITVRLAPKYAEKAKIIRALIHKIEVLPNSVRIHFKVGESSTQIRHDHCPEGFGIEGKTSKAPNENKNAGSKPAITRTKDFFWTSGSNRLTNGRPSRYLYEPTYYTDIINHSVSPLKSKSSKIAEIHLKDGLSAAQIAGELGISKTAVLEKLHTLGIRNVASKGERMTNPKNYRASVVPYGYRNVEGQLVANKKEVRICRLVVQLINESEFSLMAAARELMAQNIKNRKGNIWWDHSMVRGIYQRWNGKI